MIERPGVGGLGGLGDVGDLYVLNFLADLSGSFVARPTAASISFLKWRKKVDKGFDFGKQDINISSTFLSVSGPGPDTGRNSP